MRASRLPTAAALAAALFATGVASIGCGTSRTEASSIGADDHDRGRVLASNELTAHAGDGDEKPANDTVDGTKPPPLPSATAIVGWGVVAPVTTTAPHPVPVPHGGKIAPVTPHPLPPPPKGGPMAITPKMPGGKAPTTAMPPTTVGATSTPPCANPGGEATY